jgi:hypothetical protein
MSELLLKILIFAYAATGIVSTIGYIPTMRDLLHHKKMSANALSYIIWSITSAIGLLYAIFILPDFLFIMVSALSFVCCAIILVLSLVLGKNKRK